MVFKSNECIWSVIQAISFTTLYERALDCLRKTLSDVAAVFNVNVTLRSVSTMSRLWARDSEIHSESGRIFRFQDNQNIFI